MLLASSTLALPSAQLGAPSDATGLEARSPELHAKGSGLSIDDINRFYEKSTDLILGYTHKFAFVYTLLQLICN